MKWRAYAGKKICRGKTKGMPVLLFLARKEAGMLTYYLIQTPDKPKSECDGCPYGKNQPCIGWCTKKILQKSGGAASEGE